jgi:hypothetical protein
MKGRQNTRVETEAIMTIRPAEDLRFDPDFFRWITESYARLVGAPLVSGEKDARWLYEDAPFPVVAHNSEPDPIFIYANKAAQACFGYSWDEFITLPSRLSAGEMERAERQLLLDEVTHKGFMSGYRGLRIKKSGERFWMEGGVVWQLIDEAGIGHGQAATFSQWRDA